MPTPQTPGLDSGRAWLAAAASFIGCFVVFGILYAFGVFLKPMSADLGVSHAVMSAVFSFMSLLSYLLGPFTGDLGDHIGPKKMITAGALLLAVGMVATARSTTYIAAFLSLGTGIGTGLACVFVPGMAAVGEWFEKYRDLALGVAISGIGCGTLVSAPLTAYLIGRYGWRDTMTFLGLAGGLLLLGSVLLIASPPIKLEKKSDSRAVWERVRTPRFSLQYLSIILGGTAVFISMVYLPAFAAAEGIDRVAAAALVGYIGGASVISRLGLDALADRVGLMTVYQFSFFCICASCLVWLGAHSHLGLVLFAIVLGIGYGGLAALTPAVAIHMFGIESLGELLGILLTAYGLASVIGPPFAGYLVDRSGDYHDVVWYALLASAGACITSIALRKYSAAAAQENSDEAAA